VDRAQQARSGPRGYCEVEGGDFADYGSAAERPGLTVREISPPLLRLAVVTSENEACHPIATPAIAGPLAVDSAYQLYVNGRLLGGVGLSLSECAYAVFVPLMAALLLRRLWAYARLCRMDADCQVAGADTSTSAAADRHSADCG
jgi:hypothetical protein